MPKAAANAKQQRSQNVQSFARSKRGRNGYLPKAAAKTVAKAFQNNHVRQGYLPKAGKIKTGVKAFQRSAPSNGVRGDYLPKAAASQKAVQASQGAVRRNNKADTAHKNHVKAQTGVKTCQKRVRGRTVADRRDYLRKLRQQREAAEAKAKADDLRNQSIVERGKKFLWKAVSWVTSSAEAVNEACDRNDDLTPFVVQH